MIETCRNCRRSADGFARSCDQVCYDCLNDWPMYQCWRPRRWVPILICAAIGLALVLAMCIVIAVLDQERINARPRPEARARDFQFYEKVPVRIEDRVTWKRGETVAWTIYSVVGPSDGYAISKGE
jgi:hypothetical protein